MVLQVETKFNEEKTDLQEESKEDEELKNLTHNLNYLGSLEKSEYLFVDENLDIQCKYSKGWWKTLDNDQKKNMTKLSSKCIKHCLESIKEKKILGIDNKKVIQGISNLEWTLRSNIS